MAPNNSFERDVCYAAASHTPLKLTVIQEIMKKYSLSREYLFIIIPLILIGVTGGAILYINISILIGLPTIIVCSCLWFLFLNSSHTIIFSENSVHFKSLIKDVELRREEIISIENCFFYHRVISVKEKLYYINLIDNLPSLNQDLTRHSLNPHIVDKIEAEFSTRNNKNSLLGTVLNWSLIISGLAAVIELFFV